MSSLNARDLEFRYPGSDFAQVDNLTLSLEAGGIYLIVGDNGSGKTTLGKLLTGIIAPHSGEVVVDSRRIRDTPVAARPKQAMYMGQTSYLQFFRPSIAEEIEFALTLAGTPVAAVDAAYEAFHLPPERALKPMDLAYPEMWRLQLLLMAVIFAPAVLFVDEMVAPGSSFQREALNYVVQNRTAGGQITMVAYQRTLSWLRSRMFTLQRGKLEEI